MFGNPFVGSPILRRTDILAIADGFNIGCIPKLSIEGVIVIEEGQTLTAAAILEDIITHVTQYFH